MIQRADEHDIPAIMELAEYFSKQYGTPAPHKERAESILLHSVREGTCLIARRSDGVICGVIVGVLSAHPFMDYTMLASMFTYARWYGADLFAAFIALGKELGVDATTSSTQCSFPGKTDTFMEGMGFRRVEVGWQYDYKV